MPHAREVTRRDLLKRGSGSVALSLIISTDFARVMPTVEAAPQAVPLKVFSTQEARTLLAMAAPPRGSLPGQAGLRGP